jgi:hypothetical protein
VAGVGVSGSFSVACSFASTTAFSPLSLASLLLLFVGKTVAKMTTSTIVNVVSTAMPMRFRRLLILVPNTMGESPFSANRNESLALSDFSSSLFATMGMS